jgi:hypothetical protein
MAPALAVLPSSVQLRAIDIDRLAKGDRSTPQRIPSFFDAMHANAAKEFDSTPGEGRRARRRTSRSADFWSAGCAVGRPADAVLDAAVDAAPTCSKVVWTASSVTVGHGQRGRVDTGGLVAVGAYGGNVTSEGPRSDVMATGHSARRQARLRAGPDGATWAGERARALQQLGRRAEAAAVAPRFARCRLYCSRWTLIRPQRRIAIGCFDAT